jgi:Uma2 family endonuclease
MNRFEEVRQALTRLNESERREVVAWFERQNWRIYGADRVEESQAAYATPLPELMTLEEFLEFQEHSPIPYEFVNGVLRQISAPSVPHCRIVQNIFRAIDPHLRNGPCEPFCAGGQVRLALGTDEIVYKPDLLVSCDRDVWDKNGIPNPKFVVEVLSPSTQQIDRKEKAVNYRRVSSMEEYVIASQKRAELTIYRRVAHWLPEIIRGVRAVVEFSSLGISVPLTAIYENAFREPMSSSGSYREPM